MAPAPRHDGWGQYTNHRRATIQTWDSLETLSATETGDAQYNPHLYGTDKAVQELELLCVEKGTVIRENEHKKTAYLKMNVVVGACSGSETHYVFAECTSGFYHGRPICEAELKRLGATI